MTDLTVVIIVLVAAYFIGAIPFGVIIGRLWRGVDIRSYGSGGSGATNVTRTLGPRAGATVFAADFAKGVSVIALSRYVMNGDPWLVAAAGTVAVLGHMFPVYIKFKGGKGVSTGFGALAVISPIAAVIALVGVLIIWSHRSNVDRLAKGDESRLENKPSPRRAQRTP